MAEVLLFHHALGLTPGVGSFADRLRAAGHEVHVPDLYEGRTFTDLSDGVSHAREIGFDTVLERGRRVAGQLPDQLVYAGFSLGVMPAQQLAQTRSGARGAVLMNGCVPPEEFGVPWPAGLPLQVHTRVDDELGDADVAQELMAAVEGAELFLYPGDQHLFADDSLPDFDAGAAGLLEERVRGFLDRVGKRSPLRWEERAQAEAARPPEGLPVVARLGQPVGHEPEHRRVVAHAQVAAADGDVLADRPGLLPAAAPVDDAVPP